MKKIVIVLMVLAAFASCKVTSKDNAASGETLEVREGIVTYRFKVAGLNDSLVNDSIWKIIFQVEGVSESVISDKDSTAVFTVDPALVSNELLRREIEKRGGRLLN